MTSLSGVTWIISHRSQIRVLALLKLLLKWHVCVPLSTTAKHHCLSQPGRPQWLAIPAGRHGRTSVHAATGEGGANGRHGGTQRPARGVARRGSLIFLFSASFYLQPSFNTVFPPASALGSLPCVFSNWCDPPSCSLFIFLLSVPLCYNLPF